jgi:hypothetical protein
MSNTDLTTKDLTTAQGSQAHTGHSAFNSLDVKSDNASQTQYSKSRDNTSKLQDLSSIADNHIPALETKQDSPGQWVKTPSGIKFVLTNSKQSISSKQDKRTINTIQGNTIQNTKSNNGLNKQANTSFTSYLPDSQAQGTVESVWTNSYISLCSFTGKANGIAKRYYIQQDRVAETREPHKLIVVGSTPTPAIKSKVAESCKDGSKETLRIGVMQFLGRQNATECQIGRKLLTEGSNRLLEAKKAF